MGEQREPADELIARARRVYAECDGYADEGTRTLRIDHDGTLRGHSTTTQLRFRTRWKRPGWFYFEYRDLRPKFVFPGVVAEPAPEETGTRHAVWGTPEGAYSWWTIEPEVKRHEQLGDAIGGATGVSGGTAFNIASLLGFLERPPRWFSTPAGFYGEPDDVEGCACLRIPMVSGDNQQRLWIERARGLVLRYDELHQFTAEKQRASILQYIERTQHVIDMDPSSKPKSKAMLRDFVRQRDADKFEPFTTHSSIIYRPRLDPELKPEDFLFVPPTSL